MPARERRKLTDAAIARLRPRAREYTVWDSRAPGLGVRVRPTGGKSYVALVEAGGRSKRVVLGPVSTRSIEEARAECHERRANPEPASSERPAHSVPLFLDFVEGPWKDAYFEGYKPTTRKTYRALLDARLLPDFGAKPLDRITAAQVRSWFDAFSGTAPGNANHALALFRQIMNFGLACGHVDRNPAQDIRPNRRERLTRFLSREEIARLHATLDEHEGRRSQAQADIIRLLLLTGCRRNEILHLRRSEVRGDMLFLEDGKTGSRKVPLNAQARCILERQPGTDSPYVFPSPLDPNRPCSENLPLWYRVRREAGIEDVRLHDLRHTHASQAVMSGIPVPVVSRLLGHSNVGMTMRYAHLGDREIEQAAERIGKHLAELMGL